MDFSLTPDQEAVRDAVQKICSEFDDDYWLERDQSGDFPEEFYRSIADRNTAVQASALPRQH
jgi:acyl-CoA dehydrogenase